MRVTRRVEFEYAMRVRDKARVRRYLRAVPYIIKTSYGATTGSEGMPPKKFSLAKNESVTFSD